MIRTKREEAKEMGKKNNLFDKTSELKTVHPLRSVISLVSTSDTCNSATLSPLWLNGLLYSLGALLLENYVYIMYFHLD